ncbi:hypothetical protein [Kitasatospora sp. NPDC094011]|uniref:hypothetical protein n=1 Tax=Kitasatospora sp. NPDC094011 TaxID=3364090 RepID=UPI00380657E6
MPAASPLHLDHSTEPPVFLVSTASKTKNGTLTLTFSKPEGAADVSCRSITVQLPVGPAPTDLTTNPNPITTSYGGYGTWRITPKADERSATFVCTPQGMPGNKVLFTAGRHFTLILAGIPVARTPGIAASTITASIETAVDTERWDDKPVTSPDIAKDREDLAVPFFFRAFSSVKPRVPNGTTTELRWEGSETGVEYWLAWDDREPVEVFGQSHQTPALTDTTTFVLDARTTENGRSVSHFLSTTVTVKDPDIIAKTLTTSDRLTVTDTFTATHKNGSTVVKKVEAGTTVFAGEVTMNAKLTVNAVIQANDNVVVAANKAVQTDTIRRRLNGNGTGVKIDDALQITGTTTAAAVTASGDVTVDAARTLQAGTIKASKKVDVHDTFVADNTDSKKTWINNLSGVVDLFGDVTSVYAEDITTNYDKTYTAQTSGFVIITLYGSRTDSNKDAIELTSYFSVEAITNGYNYYTSSAQSKRSGQNTDSSLTVPVRRGHDVRIKLHNPRAGGASSHGGLKVYWVGLGNGGLTPK